MSNNPLPKTLIITTTLAVAAYISAPFMGLDGLSLGLGLFLGGLLGALLKGSSKPASAARSTSSAPASRPQASAPRSTPAASDGDSVTIFVGNLAFRASRGALAKLFSEYGEVRNVRIVTDRNTRKPKGYGFVEMPEADAAKAIAALNGEEFFGRELKVSEANERKD